MRSPWITSAANNSGIFSRDSRIAMVCIRLAMTAPLPLKTPPSRPPRTSANCPSKLDEPPAGLSEVAAPPAQAAAIRVSWPAFSTTVIRPISASTEAGNAAVPPLACCSSARAGLAVQAVTAAAPIIIARREIIRSETAAVIRSPLSMPVAIAWKDDRRKVLDPRFWIM